MDSFSFNRQPSEHDHLRPAEFTGLPLWTLVACVGGVLLWNFSFYRHADVLQPGDFGGVARASANGEADPGPTSGSKVMEGGPEFTTPPVLDAPLSLAGRSDSSETDSGVSTGAHDSVRVEPDVRSTRAEGGTAEGPGLLVEHIDPVRFVRGWFVDDLRTGLWETTYAGGEPRSSGHYDKDLREGNWSFWARSGGLVLNGDYLNGKREGVWNGWHATGARRSQQSFSSGQPSGNWVLWFSNGQVKERGQYVRGLREGAWEFFDIQGNSDLRTGLYLQGKRVSD